MTSFPQELHLKGEPVGELGVLGVSDFVIHDSLLIVSTHNAEGCWSALSLDDGFRELSKFMHIGNGPNEVSVPFGPSLSDAYFYDRDGDTYIEFRDSRRLGEILEVKVSDALQTSAPQLRVLRDSIPHTMFVAIPLDGDGMLCRELDSRQTRQDRFLMDWEGEKTVPPHLAWLNASEVMPGEDFNALTAGCRYSREHDRVVEAPTFLNTLNIYSPDGAFTRSVCCGRKAVQIADVASTPLGDRLWYFTKLRNYGKAFGVLWMDVPFSTNSLPGYATVLFFDWDGNPLYKLELDHYAESFDIDFRTGVLYGFDRAEERFWRYDISAIAAELQ